MISRLTIAKLTERRLPIYCFDCLRRMPTIAATTIAHLLLRLPTIDDLHWLPTIGYDFLFDDCQIDGTTIANLPHQLPTNDDLHRLPTIGYNFLFNDCQIDGTTIAHLPLWLLATNANDCQYNDCPFAAYIANDWRQFPVRRLTVWLFPICRFDCLPNCRFDCNMPNRRLLVWRLKIQRFNDCPFDAFADGSTTTIAHLPLQLLAHLPLRLLWLPALHPLPTISKLKIASLMIENLPLWLLALHRLPTIASLTVENLTARRFPICRFDCLPICHFDCNQKYISLLDFDGNRCIPWHQRKRDRN